MKYKKTLIILSSVVGSLLLIFILSFTLFRVHNVKLNFKNQTTIYASEERQTAVINSGNISRSVPIFSINKKVVAENLERENSYLKVINIETIFPNTLIIHCAEREELYSIKIGENLYYYCDEDLKILRLDTSYVASQTGAILLEGVEVMNPSAKVGEYIKIISDEELVKSLGDVFAFNNKTIADVRGMFKEIKLSYKKDYYTAVSAPVLTFVTFDDFCVELGLANSYLIEKVNLMLALIPQSASKYGEYKLIIEINPQNVADSYIRYEKLK